MRDFPDLRQFRAKEHERPEPVTQLDAAILPQQPALLPSTNWLDVCSEPVEFRDLSCSGFDSIPVVCCCFVVFSRHISDSDFLVTWAIGLG